MTTFDDLDLEKLDLAPPPVIGAPRLHRTYPDRLPRQARLLALIIAGFLVALTGWSWGGTASVLWHSTGTGVYAPNFGAAKWITAQGAGPQAFFRLTIDLPSKPDSALMWIDSDQDFRLFVNGSSGPNSVAALRGSVPPRTKVIDMTSQLRIGTNVIALQVTNADNGNPSLLALARLSHSGVISNYETGISPWRVTANAAQLRVNSTPYTAPRFDDAQWPPATVIDAPRQPGGAPIPTDVLVAPLGSDVLGSVGRGADLVAQTTIRVPTNCANCWIRVAAAGAYTIVVNGSPIYYQSQPAARKPTDSVALRVYNIGPLLRPGTDTLSVHVVAATTAALYLDGRIGNERIATGPGWTSPANQTSAPLLDLGTPSTIWPTGLYQLAVLGGIHSTPSFIALWQPLLWTAGAVLLWLAIGLGAMYRLRLGRSCLVATAVGQLGLFFLIGSLRQFTKFADAPTNWPFWPLVLAVVALSIIVQTSVLLAVWRRSRRRNPSDLPLAPAAPIAQVRSWITAITARTWYRAGIGLVAVGATAKDAIGLNYQPLWQDEVTSIIAAQSMVKHDGVPRLPSGLLYFKGEFYHALLAVVGSASGWNVTAMRALSVAWFFGCVVAFGLLLMPTVLPGRRLLCLTATAVFATAPAESVWAGTIRMYQQEQFFAIVLISLLIRAFQTNGRRYIVGSAVTLLAMYLSHEESFVLLPGIAAMFLISYRAGWWHRRIWLLSWLPIVAVIALQYKLSKIHPPIFGADLSSKPYVMWDTSQATYYLNGTFFKASAHGGSLRLVSVLATVATVTGIFLRSYIRLVLAVLVWTAIATMSLLFTAKVGRYTFVTIPPLFALGALGAADLIDGLRRFLAWSRAEISSRPMARWIAIPATLWLVLSLTGGPRDYGLAVARATDTPISHGFTDYQNAAAYVKAREQPGDLFITICPPDVPAYYLGRPPDMIVQTGRNKLLYIIEQHGTATDTIYGAPVILTAAAMQNVMHQHHRIWLITDQGSYLDGVPPAITHLVTTSFTQVYRGEASSVFLWSV